jgi:hypothetical protein
MLIHGIIENLFFKPNRNRNFEIQNKCTLEVINQMKKWNPVQYNIVMSDNNYSIGNYSIFFEIFRYEANIIG